MLGKIFGALAVLSLITAIFTGNLSKLGPAALGGAEETLRLILTLAGMMCFWGGMMNVLQKSGVTERVNRAAAPLLRRIFPSASENPRAIAAMTANITANVMGIGNAATPAGLQAMSDMSEGCSGGIASSDMILFVCVNCASVQLIPTTLLNLRQAAGSADTSGVIVPIWISSAVCMGFMLTVFCAFRFIAGRRRRQ